MTNLIWKKHIFNENQLRSTVIFIFFFFDLTMKVTRYIEAATSFLIGFLIFYISAKANWNYEEHYVYFA
jgi:hypothetical protein